jgi:hypothetical protein
MKVYLSVPIIANRDLKRAHFISKTIEAMGHDVVSKWVNEADPGYSITPLQVFERDTRGVENSDVLVADISMPSHGVGMEIVLAYTHGKRIICLFMKGAVISRMIRGIPGAFLIEYESEKEMAERLKKLLEKKESYGENQEKMLR